MSKKEPYTMVNILTNPMCSRFNQKIQTCKTEKKDLVLPQIYLNSETLKYHEKTSNSNPSSEAVSIQLKISDPNTDSMTPHHLSVHDHEHLGQKRSVMSILSMMADRSNRPSVFSNLRKGIGICLIKIKI